MFQIIIMPVGSFIYHGEKNDIKVKSAAARQFKK